MYNHPYFLPSSGGGGGGNLLPGTLPMMAQDIVSQQLLAAQMQMLSFYQTQIYHQKRLMADESREQIQVPTLCPHICLVSALILPCLKFTSSSPPPLYLSPSPQLCLHLIPSSLPLCFYLDSLSLSIPLCLTFLSLPPYLSPLAYLALSPPLYRPHLISASLCLTFLSFSYPLKLTCLFLICSTSMYPPSLHLYLPSISVPLSTSIYPPSLCLSPPLSTLHLCASLLFPIFFAFIPYPILPSLTR